MTLTQILLDRLEPENLKLQRFQEITARLFAWGIIVRDEDGVEQRYYDDACRIENLLTEYFALAGFRLIHDLQNEFFRLYAPGAQIPGLAEDDNDPAPSLRARLSADFVAAALALRFLYQQGLAEGGGRLSDDGEVLIRFEELATTQQIQIKRPLPDNLGDRDRLLKDLKRHRLIQYGALFSMHDEDALIAIRPTILGIIGEDVLAAALEAEGIIDVAGEPESGDHSL
ncbi:MAG: DUF4194 domain-containing protein [Methylicorpusculum sp.]|uniref:DUF4194 domain-containing protein n=1 Tax=Methylicorpusculum sp. TaxID=2713644 RepID=UPI00271F9AF1|nr:DUF4194 domain-containing protein [Methylicorpusculum sp.]MDO8844183.1 DUF4194 domain-containing protein [Methylicorpusculum sp.]MDO8937805.1 DUF4194 domain-containing protein [Methylicorpusculum sp.]MDP2203279.1 DUF4194 domain-containing protein [Methylicorpusculum sp.]